MEIENKCFTFSCFIFSTFRKARALLKSEYHCDVTKGLTPHCLLHKAMFPNMMKTYNKASILTGGCKQMAKYAFFFF